MLIFIDQPKAIRVMRLEQQGDGGATRTRLGSVGKNKMEISEELRGVLSPDEVREVEEIIALYRKADKSQRSVDIYRFPQIVREVAEYITSGEADEFERRVLVASLMDGIRLIRKHERQASEI
jgi:hypothetical protein